MATRFHDDSTLNIFRWILHKIFTIEHECTKNRCLFVLRNPEIVVFEPKCWIRMKFAKVENDVTKIYMVTPLILWDWVVVTTLKSKHPVKTFLFMAIYRKIRFVFFLSKMFNFNSYGPLWIILCHFWLVFFHLDFESKSWTRTKLLKINEKNYKNFPKLEKWVSRTRIQFRETFMVIQRLIGQLKNNSV